jgi:hypothetical protein
MMNMTTMQAAAWEMIFEGVSVRLSEAIISREAGHSMANVANPSTIFPSVRMVVFRRSAAGLVSRHNEIPAKETQY